MDVDAMTGPKVALITQWFPPEPALQPLWIARALRRGGFDMSILTGVPNYPSGKVAPGYQAWRQTVDDTDGFRVHRAPLYPSHDAGSVGRILNYVSWAISASLFGVRRLKGLDVQLVYSSPATAALPALFARALFGVPFVLLVEDVWPDSVFSSGFLNGRCRGPVEWLLNRFVNVTYRRAQHIAVISPGMIELLVARGVPRSKLTLIYNWVEDAPNSVDDGTDWRKDWGLTPEDFIVMYAGNHGGAQSLSAVIEAFGRVPLPERCHLVLVGDGVEKTRLKELASRVASERVHFVPTQPRDSMWNLMRAADAQLVALADRPVFSVTIPSKLPSIMAAGHPILAVADGDVARVVHEAACGASARPGSPLGIATALLAMRRTTPRERFAMGERGKNYYRENMSMAVGSQRLLAILSSAVERADH